MNLQESIRRILREEYNEKQMKLLTLASQVGFLKTAEMTGGIENFLSILGDEFLSTNNKIKIIKEILEDKGLGNYGQLKDTNIGVIVVSITGEKFSQIEYINRKGVVVVHYGGNYYQDYLGITKLLYEELPKDILDKLYKKVLNYYN